MFKLFADGQKVKFNPTRDDWEDDYGLDGVWVGDQGTVTTGNYEENGDVWIDFVRQDGTVCNRFCAFAEDLEAVDDVA